MLKETCSLKPVCSSEQRILNLQALRNEELNHVLSSFPQGAHILEIGAGAGWQALTLQSKGHYVQAVDLYDSSYLDHAVYPVIPYDGHSLPFSSGSFDVVFSPMFSSIFSIWTDSMKKYTGYSSPMA